MKRCPTCEKTFDDGMRFCQVDGTPLVDIVGDDAPQDPFKTIVATTPKNTASSIPVDLPVSPLAETEKEEDILQIPEPFDSMKTMIAGDRPKPEILETEPPAAAEPVSDPVAIPEPPKFSEPAIAPPDMGLMAEADISEAPTRIGNSAELDAGAISTNEPVNEPLASPSQDMPIADPIPSPDVASDMAEPQSAGIPSPFDAPPASPFAEAEPTVIQPAAAAPEWNPPPAPVAQWQDQGVGANTPFQPPAIAIEGANKTLPIVSLVLGIISLCCYISPLTGLAALVTGYMGMNNVKKDPNTYGGKTLALVGMILGGIFFLVGVAYYIYIILVLGFALSQ